jgi:hypothetical protein
MTATIPSRTFRRLRGGATLLAIALLCAASMLRAQDAEGDRPPEMPEAERTGVVAGIHLMLNFPRGDFQTNVESVGFGGNLDIGYNFPNMPLVAGMQLGYVVYGSKTYRTRFSQSVPVDVDVDATNSIGMLHLYLRMMPMKGDVRPYFEGLAGGNLFVTSVTVKNRSTDAEIASDTKNSDVAFSYGGGAGLLVRLWSGAAPDQANHVRRGMDVYLDARLRYLYGGNAEYYTNASIYQAPNGDVVFDKNGLTKSKTDFVTGQLGITVRF